MNLMINTVHDLIHILKTRPEWRQEVKEALFPGVDLEKALKELAATQKRGEEGVQRLEELARLLIEAQFKTEKRLDKIEQNQVVFKSDIEELKHNQEELKRNQRDLKGTSYENKLSNKADAIFGRYLRRGRKVRNEVGDYLDEAEDNGQLSEEESIQVFAADLLWGGKLKSTKEQTILVVEASWMVEQHDLERAITRASILHRIGLQALPVVAGVNWVGGLKEEALCKGVVMVDDKWLDKASWEAALTKML